MTNGRSSSIGTVPENLYASIKAPQRSEFLTRALGHEMLDKLPDNKRIDRHRYRCHVASFELEEHLGVL